MTKLWLISDLHFGHANVIQYENRPFENVTVMEEHLIRNWNKHIRDCDKVIVAGDFSFLNKEETQRILQQLNGFKTLIMGNHDRRKSRVWWLDAGFSQVIEYPILLNGRFIISHEPLEESLDSPFVNIHGHSHSFQYPNNNYYNVCVEVHNYMPVDFETIKAHYNNESDEVQ